jgi:hypothetical protein
VLAGVEVEVAPAQGVEGLVGSPFGLAALLDLSTLTWASTGSMSKSRVGETATLLPNGQVLFAGRRDIRP